jgi:2'-5' RNA ligase
MLGVVSKIPEPVYSRVLKLWDSLEEEFGFSGIKVMPIPHFTWHVSTDYDISEVIHELILISRQAKPFEVETNGLSFFLNDLFVAYNGIGISPKLATMHKHMCSKINPYSYNRANYYFPENWIPHVTLVLENLIYTNQKQSLRRFLRKFDLDWKFTVNNFLLVNQVAKKKTVIEHEFKFKK